MAAGDALRIPIRGATFRLHTAIYRLDGSLITGPSSPVSSISKDDGTAAAAGAPAEIAAGTGMLYLDLTAAEMTADLLAVRVTSGDANAGHTVHYFSPHRLATIVGLTGATAQAGAAGSITLPSTASASDDAYNGCWVLTVSGTGSGQARQIYDYNGTTKIATVVPNWTTTPDMTTVLDVGTPIAAIATGNLATVQQVVDGHYEEQTSLHTTAGSYGLVLRRTGDLEFKRATAYTNFQFWMTSSADHISPIAGRSIVAQRLIDGGSWNYFTNQPAGVPGLGVTDLGQGAYKIDITGADVAGRDILFLFTAAGSDATRFKVTTQL